MLQYLIVGVPSVPAFAFIENRRAFICAAQLLSIESDLFPAAFLASLADDGAGLSVCFGDNLHFGPFCAQCRGESIGLGVSNDHFRR